MKYFNHMTCAGDDGRISALRDLHGLAGYGAYWLLIERIAAQIRPESVSTSLTLSWKKWALFLEIRTSSARKLIETQAKLGLISLESNSTHATIDIPNILKYCDEYTKKVRRVSGQTPDKLRSDSGTPALPALQDKQDLKPGPVDNSEICGIPTGAKPADGGVLEAPPPPAPTPVTRRARAPDLEPGRMTPEELMAAARITGAKLKAT